METKEQPPSAIVTNIYKPPGSSSLDKAPVAPQVRLGLQGYPGVGKTWEALTSPNPIVMNLDRGLGAHVGREDVIDVPFYSPSFVDSIIKRDGLRAPPNRKDAILIWLASEAMKLSSSQTLIIDSCTQLQNAHLAQYNLNPKITKSGKVDDFGLYADKLSYFGEVCEQLKLLPCNVIFLSHETAARDTEGDLNGQVRPLLSGQFGDQLSSHFTDWFRCHAVAKPESEDTKKRFLEKICFGSKELMEELINSTKPEHKTIYLFQTMNDDMCKCKTSSLIDAPKYIIAHWSSFLKYRRKQTTT